MFNPPNFGKLSYLLVYKSSKNRVFEHHDLLKKHFKIRTSELLDFATLALKRFLGLFLAFLSSEERNFPLDDSVKKKIDFFVCIDY